MELWLRSGSSRQFQRISLELFTPDSAAELVRWFPAATVFPEPHLPTAGAQPRPTRASSTYSLFIALSAVALVVGLMLMVLLYRRVY
ncbi:MAG: hypothetical protein H0X13_20320 [Ramlibacter sp.]|nr:hypothetical protein [Ramlibacter sp.]